MKQQLMLVAMLSVGTALTTMGRIKPVAASLTPPASYDYSYTWNATASEQYLNVNGVDSIPLYTRSVAGSFFNYVTTFALIPGVVITQTFNSSNTAWQTSGTFYKPDENRIGASSVVGSVARIIITIDNQTSNNYDFFFDYSSTGGDRAWRMDINDIQYFNYVVPNAGNPTRTSIIQAFTKYTIRAGVEPSTFYFDAWYIKDLGINQAYQNGLDAETDGILTDYLGTDAQQIGWVLIGIAAILFAFKGGK